MGDPLLFSLSALIAFAIGAVVVGIDCWRQNSAEFVYSTHPIYRDFFGILFCCACGLIAALAFAYVQYDRESWIAKTISLNADATLARGFYVGVMVMVLIRSKALQLGKDSGDLGLEFFYLRFREAILERLRRRRADEKARFVENTLPKIVAMDDFANELDARMRDVLGDTDRRKTYIKQRDAISTPTKAFAVGDNLWRIYYKTLLRNAVDFVGIDAISAWIGIIER